MILYPNKRGQGLPKLPGYRRIQFQPHDCQMIPLLEELFHLTAKIFLVILKFFLIKADVGVAGHDKDAVLLYAVGVNECRQPAQQDVLRAHEPASV